MTLRQLAVAVDRLCDVKAVLIGTIPSTELRSAVGVCYRFRERRTPSRMLFLLFFFAEDDVPTRRCFLSTQSLQLNAAVEVSLWWRVGEMPPS